MDDLSDRLQAWAAARGYLVRWVPPDLLLEVNQSLAERRAGGELDEEFFASEVEPLVRPSRIPSGKTVVVLAAPAPACEVRFDLGGKEVSTLLPPTYFRYSFAQEEVRRDLVENGLGGAETEHLTAPLKALANRMGLVEYGRNNVTYASGLGSYIQLFGYLTDAPLAGGTAAANAWPTIMERCRTCSACRRACPTGAIAEERILLRVERCLTYVNENPGPWPEWLPRSAHNSLIGCLACQRVCPANPELPRQPSGIRFTPPETEAFLNEAAGRPAAYQGGIAAKLAWLGRSQPLSLLGRNLKALLEAERPASVQ